ncbi:hypothetical protein B0H14DRAFT_2836610 [Mycena olivaceomarginata]|nr:hypothetical protein B0H14DRAFT_2836610 [Mycena olivaceomarginata]
MSTPNLIHSLPNELLVAIASAGQEDRVADLTTPHSGWSTQPTAFCSEWTLSHLSHRFRDVISGASELWTLTEANFAAEGSVEIFKLYLERSRACKISVTLRVFPESNIIESGLPMWTGQIVVAHLNRIWSLRILVRTWPGGADMLGLFRDAAAPQLQQLEVIHISDEDQFPNPDGAVGFFSSGAPRLGSLIIDGFTLQAAAQWRATLTHLDIRRAECTLSAINQYLSLAHLRLDMVYVAMGTTPLRLPTLKSLDLWIPEDGEDYLAGILEHFDLPTLTELTVEGSHGDQIALLFSRTSFLGSNFPALASVSFVFRDSCPCETEPDFTPKHTISSPPAVFPALSHLTLINQCFTHTLIQDILGPASHLWPLLKGVTLCPRKDSLENVCSALEDAVKGKRQRGYPLPKTTLFRPPISFENWKDISSMDVEMVW